MRTRNDLAPWARWMPGWLLMMVLWVLATITLPHFIITRLTAGALDWWVAVMSETTEVRAMLRAEKSAIRKGEK